jgi:hypothetical protein
MSITFENDNQTQESNFVDTLLDYENENDSLMEAIKRIEQAKLYESLIKHDFFAPGSARPEIQDKVTNEIRAFILERLQELVGMKAPKQTINQNIQSPFDEDEIFALKEIAGKLIKKSQGQPQIQTSPQVNRYVDMSTESMVVQTRPASPTVNQVKAQPQAQQAKPKSQAPKQPVRAQAPAAEEPRPEGGIYKPQAVSKVVPPKKMPSQVEMNAMNAMAVAKRQANTGSGVMDQMLRLASTHAQHINRNVVED